ncbi:glycine cleavage system protein GcvH [Hydrogenophaga sp.]|uniref:glycine cleavage system protein GcvH n=1 Tax=Hydrogenophaga sp. TaxID=1904254 RepID=UPI002619673A|nr:glycine cleavage system protein GcvH [Hydrogenophaga sp.]MCW5654873.1 glycine cleavage system protein GcvH [Hydrogenophaga sp.]
MKKFSNEHVWISLQDGVATVGITAHAQETLGDIVSTELPEAGSRFGQGDAAGVVESTKTAADVHMPVDGEILEVNEAVVSEPGLLNTDPLGEGWLLKVRPADEGQLGGLMDEAQYQAFIGA